MARAYNSEGIKMMYGGSATFNKKGLPPPGSCCFCEELLMKIDRVSRCLNCKAIFILQKNGLLKYIGKLS
jgi:hypothetical protein